VNSHYTILNQVETVSIEVNDANGVPTSGSVAVTDGGQTQTVNVVNGMATAVFVFQLFAEQPYSHQVTAFFGTQTAVFTAPDTAADYYAQLFFDLIVIMALSGA
jgi:hypothetical protein